MDMRCLMMAMMLLASTAEAQERGRSGIWNVGVTAGTTGIGADVSMSLSPNVQLRAGGIYVPRFEKTMNFGVEVGKDHEGRTEEQNAASKRYYMDNIRNFMHNFINYDMQDNIDMVGSPSFGGAKLLVDWMPLRDKRWHVTAGVYLGGRTIAKAANRQEDMTTLMGVNIYNDLYRKAAAREPMFTAGGVDVEIPNHFVEAMLVDYGEMAITLGEFRHDIIATEDVYWDYDYYEFHRTYVGELVHAKGELRCAKGEVLYHEGDIYRMTPSADNEVNVRMKVNPVRPYIGCGYNGSLTRDGSVRVGMDCGLMLWGGSPRAVTHEGIDLVHDLRNVRGKVGDYVKLIKGLKAYPVVELRLSVPM